MIDREIDPIYVDVDKDRLREIVSESIVFLHEYLGGEFSYTDSQIMNNLEKIISSNMIATEFFLNLGSKKIPDLILRVDPRRRKVLLKSHFKKKVARLNYFLRTL